MSRKITCVIVDDEPVAREILESFVAKVPNLLLIKSCKNGLEAFELINKEKIDLLFLDINMPEISGLSLAKMIGTDTKVIFTTAYREYAVDGFDLKVVDYLLKPIAFERFLAAINKCFEATYALEIQSESIVEKSNFFFVRSDRKMIKISFDEILYVESLSDYIKIITNSGTIITRETMTNIETKLPESQFLRVHRSFVISLKNIISYTNEYLEIGKKAIPISRKYKEVVLKKLQKI